MSDDERLLTGEVRRALGRLQAVRKLVQQMRMQGAISMTVADKLDAVSKFGSEG